jgi:D-serine deaminase-like pyridoxal phosphate-dependent protein
MAQQEAVTEIRPGNYVFSDANQVRLGRSTDLCALTVLATVIARPSATEALVDAGTKTLSGDRDPVYGYGLLAGDPLARLDWCSEEHGHLHLGLSAYRPAVGDKVRIVPAHACTCVNMHPELHVVDEERVVGSWSVAARDCST